MVAKKEKTSMTEVSEINMEEIRFNVLGTSPMIMNRFNQKAWQELLLPSSRQSRATLESKLKHNPVEEFRGAMYRNSNNKAPSLIHVPNGAFHGALAQAGVDIPGAAKAKLERLTSVVDVNINLFGVPHLFMSMVRNSDMNRTPDVRTRPIFPEWACTVTIHYVKQLLTRRTIANLFGAAGVIVGIGDWRPQKGGPYGKWRLVSDSDAQFKNIVKNQGRAAQQAAVDNPIFYDAETEQLMTWFEGEVERRERGDPAGEISPEIAAEETTGRKSRRGTITEGPNGQMIDE